MYATAQLYVLFRFAQALKSPIDDGSAETELCQVELRQRTRPNTESHRQPLRHSDSTPSTAKSSWPSRPMSLNQPAADHSDVLSSTGDSNLPAGSRVGPAVTSDSSSSGSWEQGELLILMYVLGGREVGQVTVFRRPLSLWKLDLTKL